MARWSRSPGRLQSHSSDHSLLHTHSRDAGSRREQWGSPTHLPPLHVATNTMPTLALLLAHVYNADCVVLCFRLCGRGGTLEEGRRCKSC